MQNEEIHKATAALRKAYDKYKDAGLVSVFLWGSIISTDFNSESSDIDSIGFVEDGFPLDLEKEIQEFLKKEYTAVKKFGFRLLYLSEFNGGPVKGNLANFIPPKLLLHDLPAWKFVVGRKLSQADFHLSVPSKEEAIKLQIDDTEKRLNGIKQSSDSQFVVKSISRLVDHVQAKRLPHEPFAYKALITNISTELERKVVDAIFESKNSGWNNNVFTKSVPVFQEYITDIRKRVS